MARDSGPPIVPTLAPSGSEYIYIALHRTQPARRPSEMISASDADDNSAVRPPSPSWADRLVDIHEEILLNGMHKVTEAIGVQDSSVGEVVESGLTARWRSQVLSKIDVTALEVGPGRGGGTVVRPYAE